MQVAFVCDRLESVNRVYAKGRREQIAEIAQLYPTIITAANLAEHAPELTQVEAAFSTWGMPRLEGEQLDRLPALKAVFYAAGTVKAFAEPLLERGIMVASAWAANAIPVAEYALAQIILANKGFFRNTRQCETYEGRRSITKDQPGNFGEAVALLGAGMVGRALINLLKVVNLHIIVWDPFLSDEAAAKLGVEKVDTLQEAFQRGIIVSNHLANVPETVGLLTGELFESMRPSATFINTGRGATVVEPDLIRVLTERPDLVALLDVTWPEPPEEGSPFYTLPNVWLTPHIAGSLGDEVVRMADYMIEEFLAWREGKPLRYKVTPEMLATMA